MFDEKLRLKQIAPAIFSLICFIQYLTDEPEIVEILLKNHADVNRQDKLGRTPLYMATTTNSEKVIDLLVVNAKANLNLAEKHGRTPLHEAAKCGYNHIAKILIDNGADLFAKDKKGRTAKDIATRRGILKKYNIHNVEKHSNLHRLNSFRPYRSCKINR